MILIVTYKFIFKYQMNIYHYDLIMTLCLLRCQRSIIRFSGCHQLNICYFTTKITVSAH